MKKKDIKILLVDADKIHLWVLMGQVEGIFPFAAAQFQHNRSIVFEILAVPLPLKMKIVPLQQRPLRLDDVVEGFVFLKPLELILTSHGPNLGEIMIRANGLILRWP